MTEDLAFIARDQQISLEQVIQAVQLLDEGNTIPFITRFRKDRTGGLNADQLRSIKQRVGELRALNERKAFILKSIESQGALTPELAEEIKRAVNSRRLEDLYLPYKAKKQSLALTAKQQGLEPLANEIYSGEYSEEQIAARAIEFVRVDRGLNNVQEVMQGVSHLIAERFAERGDVRRELRDIIWQTGQLTSRLVIPPDNNKEASSHESPVAVAAQPAGSSPELSAVVSSPPQPAAEIDPLPDSATTCDSASPAPLVVDHPIERAPVERHESLPSQSSVVAATAPAVAEPAAGEPAPGAAAKIPAPAKPEKGKKKKKKPAENPFRDFHEFAESLKKIPHHRVLAINRGERAGQLKAKIKIDYEKIAARTIALLVPDNHPFRELMIRCVHDSLTRLILPSLEREIRRELTEMAERHAVAVFAKNLKKLLLKPPVRNKRILSIDPGYKSGCSLAVLDARGNVLHTDRLFVVGNAKRRSEHQERLANLVCQYEVDIIAIGNGAACRETEQMVSDVIREKLSHRPVKYVIVNEAGASIYSTSEIGCEELPDLPPHARSAVSIGRRLLDPLSELVKISPGHLGVGLYQHDIKAKHLAESLDEVVEVCVNHVGVDANMASPALLRYVAGLNQSTAKRLVEFRQQKPLTHRQMLREVPGIGEQTFIQSAGFLRVYGGEEPFDETAIHPESYALCDRILARIGWTKQQWIENRRALKEQESTRSSGEDGASTGALPLDPADQALAAIDPAQLAAEFQVGEMLMRDLIESLRRPLHDPRQEYAAPVFRSGIIRLENLEPGMKLESQIVNVVDFGVFVDVGLGYSCLVHVSELSPRFVRDLYEEYSVGDALTTWVKEIDTARRRVKLTAIEPGTRRSRNERTRHGDPRNRDRQPKTVSASSETNTKTVSASGKKQTTPAAERTPRSFVPQARPQQKNRTVLPNRQHQMRSRERPPKPKTVVPITSEMISGKKPMRSFSDLAQFFQIKQESTSAPPASSQDSDS